MGADGGLPGQRVKKSLAGASQRRLAPTNGSPEDAGAFRGGQKRTLRKPTAGNRRAAVRGMSPDCPCGRSRLCAVTRTTCPYWLSARRAR
jgi:hypothetical protein